MKLAIVGSRSITDREYVFDKIDEYFDSRNITIDDLDDPPVILSGGAKGVDTLAKMFADEYGFDFVLFKPYHMIDKNAEFDVRYFFVRNKQIVDNCDEVLCIWDGGSRGCMHTVNYAKSVGKPVTIITKEE